MKIAAGTALIFICNFFTGHWAVYAAGGLVSFGIYLITKMIMKDRLGWGDVFFSFFSGLCLTPFFAILSVFISVIIGGIFIFSGCGKNKRTAFVPFMTAGLFICYLLAFL